MLKARAKSKPKLLWIPKVLSTLYIALLTRLSLEAFSGNISFFQQTIQFLIHMIPVIILIGLFIISRNRPKVGGTLFLATALMLTLFLNTFQTVSNFLAISFPLSLIGLLFILFGFMDDRI